MNSSENNSSYIIGILYAATAGLMWSVLAIAMKVALNFMDGFTISWFRFTFSFILLFSYLAYKKNPALNILKKPPLLSLLASVCLLANYIFYINGVRLTSPSLAQVMIQLAPLGLVIIGIGIFKERLSKRQIAGLCLSFLGFYFFYKDQLDTLIHADLGPNFSYGAMLIIIAAITWAIYGAFQKILLRTWTSHHINLVLYALPVLLLFPWVDFHSFTLLNWWQWLVVIFLGLNTIVSYTAISEAWRILPTTQVSMIVTLNPILTIIIMTILYYLEVTWIHAEKITSVGFLGALMVVTGAMIVLYRPQLNFKKKN